MALRKNKLFIKFVKCFWAKQETEYLGFIDGNGVVRTSPYKVAVVEDSSLLETRKQIISFVAFCSFYGKLFTTLWIVRLH